MDKPIRTSISGPDAMPLLNRGKAWMRHVENMPDAFPGNPILSEAFRNSLANKTLVAQDGSVLRMQRGPINFVSAKVPSTKPVVPSQLSIDLFYVSINVFDANSNVIGVYIAPAATLANWVFVPLSPPPIAAKASRTVAREGLVLGTVVAGYSEVLPNLLQSDFGTVVQVSDGVAESTDYNYSNGTYPAGRVMGSPPNEGDPCTGVSWDISGAGAWAWRDALSAAATTLAARYNVLAIGSLSGTSTKTETTRYKTTIHGVTTELGHTDKTMNGSVVFPLSGPDWYYRLWTYAKTMSGEQIGTGSSKIITSIDGTRIDGLVAVTTPSTDFVQYDPWNADVLDTSAPDQWTVSEFLYPQTRYMRLMIDGTVINVDSDEVATSGTPGLEHEYFPMCFRRYKIGNEWALYSYRDRSGAGGVGLYKVAVGLCIGGVNRVANFTDYDGAFSTAAHIDIDGVGRGYLDVSNARLLTKRI